MISEGAGLRASRSSGTCSPPRTAGVFLHAGIKFPWFVFFQKDAGLRPADPPWNMRAAMVLLGRALPRARRRSRAPLRNAAVPGRFRALYRRVTSSCQLQLLLFSGLAFFLLLRWLKRTLTITLDVDWFYRKLGRDLARYLQEHCSSIWQAFAKFVRLAAETAVTRLDLVYRDGVLSRQQASGNGALIALAALVLYLLIQFAW